MKVNISDECVGCGLCVETCPDVFEMADDKAQVKAETVPSELEDAVRSAAQDCPVEAIEIQE